MGRPKVTKEQWLDAGIIAFAESGFAGVVVEQMATELKSNKSGFYWYFGNREGFFASLFEYWKDKETESFFRLADKEPTPIDQFSTLFRSIASTPVHIDFQFHMRRAGQKDVRVKRILASIESRRISYVASILAALGLSQDESAEVADFMYSYAIGWLERNHQRRATKHQIEKQLGIAMRLLHTR